MEEIERRGHAHSSMPYILLVYMCTYLYIHVQYTLGVINSYHTYPGIQLHIRTSYLVGVEDTYRGQEEEGAGEGVCPLTPLSKWEEFQVAQGQPAQQVQQAQLVPRERLVLRACRRRAARGLLGRGAQRSPSGQWRSGRVVCSRSPFAQSWGSRETVAGGKHKGIPVKRGRESGYKTQTAGTQSEAYQLGTTVFS